MVPAPKRENESKTNQSILKVLTKVSNEKILRLLQRELNKEKFEIVVGQKSSPTLNLVMNESPDILVLELDEEEQSPEMSAYILRKVLPNLKIIVISKSLRERSQKAPGQGIFCHLANSGSENIVPVIISAADEIQRMTEKK